MFENEVEQAAKVARIQAEILDELKIPHDKFRQVFFSRRCLRLNDFGFQKFKDTKPFKEVELDVGSFKMQDLMKISKLNSDLFYIDKKNVKVYTCDAYFVNWCKLNSGNINAVRFSA
jgi:hypothetical protein